jgi:hypothetical protein
MDAIVKIRMSLRSRASGRPKQSGSSGHTSPFQSNKNRGEVT